MGDHGASGCEHKSSGGEQRDFSKLQSHLTTTILQLGLIIMHLAPLIHPARHRTVHHLASRRALPSHVSPSHSRTSINTTTPAMSSSSSDDTRLRIVRSLFARKAEDGTLEETLVTYLRVKEDDGHGNAKTRYLFLAGRSSGAGRGRLRVRSAAKHAPCGERSEAGLVWAAGLDTCGERRLTPVTRLGECMLHKGKSNSNGTFSRGKTWRLSDMRALEQMGVSLRMLVQA